ncbi:hypothetical protein ACF0H5_007490 [Mactra antiquata]
MPGIVVFGRRWSVGSDDLVVPALPLVIIHLAWLAALAAIFTTVEFITDSTCSMELKDIILGYIVILLACIVVEGIITIISIRGSILDTEPRISMQYLLYVRIVVFISEFCWLIFGIRWIVRFYFSCEPDAARKALLGVSITNGFMILLGIISIWCTFDSAGRKWVKFKRYQESMKEKTHRSRRSGSARRNWRQRLIHPRIRQQHSQCQYMQRKAMRAYEESWDRRLGLMCCCVERKGRNKNSMSEIAQLFTEFFRDLDVVPSDVIAGLVLLRRYQKLRMEFTINQDVNDVHRYLSGVAVTPRTQFLQLGQPEVMNQYKQVIHYMKFAMAAYGWPLFMMMNTGTGLCRIVPYLRCCCCQQTCCDKSGKSDYELNDNCCQCNVVALKKISGLPDLDLIYVTYHVDIGETPFYVALDNKYKKIVICVRGTLSLQDVLTDLKADAETLPLDPVKEDWVAHKGMVQAAIYIKKKLKEDLILAKAFQKAKEQSEDKYDLVLVGHSLGAGTAAILAILLQQEYEDLHCYAYSPPGGLLSHECMEATKSYITSVVIAKDVVPRIGLHQMELLRTDLINIIKKSKNPKWKIIMKALCCSTASASQINYEDIREDLERDITKHPSDEQIGLTAHKPMFPPGKIILVVRKHSGKDSSCCGQNEPVYQAIWADNSDFQEVLVSPTMVNDHMPDNVLEALEKVLVNVAPPKPTRLLTESERKALLKHETSPGSPVSQQTLPVIHHGDQVQCLPVKSNVGHQLTSIPVDVYMNSNNAGWDAATEELLLSLDKQHLFPGLGHNPRLELMDLDSDWIQAPLATPEVLSAASSMSTLSRAGSIPKGEHKSETMSAKLATIQQSPEIRIRADNSGAGSVEQLEETENESEVLTKQENTLNESVSVGDFIKKSHLLKTELGYEGLAHASQGSLNNFLPSADVSIVNETEQVNSSNADTKNSQNPTDSSNTDSNKKHDDHDSVDFNENNKNLKEINHNTEEIEHYERHSPVESNQFGYLNPNEHYSAASFGYHPIHSNAAPYTSIEHDITTPYTSIEHDITTPYTSIEHDITTPYTSIEHGITTPYTSIEHDIATPYTSKEHDIAIPITSVEREHNNVTAEGNKSVPHHPPHKILHYSHSESRLKGLSEEYKMKRSTEEGDIAHLEDTSNVFVQDTGAGVKKTLKSRDSAPMFDKKLLPKIQSECKLSSVQEHETHAPENCDTDNTLNETKNELVEGDIENKIDNKTGIVEQVSLDNDNVFDTENSDRTCLINRDKCKDITFTDQGSHLNSPDEDDTRLFHSNSIHSTFANSSSGESEQRLSLLSSNSEDLPIVETDV